jgi:hypothetical protein
MTLMGVGLPARVPGLGPLSAALFISGTLVMTLMGVGLPARVPGLGPLSAALFISGTLVQCFAPSTQRKGRHSERFCSSAVGSESQRARFGGAADRLGRPFGLPITIGTTGSGFFPPSLVENLGAHSAR